MGENIGVAGNPEADAEAQKYLHGLQQGARDLNSVVSTVRETGLDSLDISRGAVEKLKDIGFYALLGATAHATGYDGVAFASWLALGFQGVKTVYDAEFKHPRYHFHPWPRLKSGLSLAVWRSRKDFSQVKEGDVVLNVAAGYAKSPEDSQLATHKQLIEFRELSKDTEYSHVVLPKRLVRMPKSSKTASGRTRSEVVQELTGHEASFDGKSGEEAVVLWSKKTFDSYAKDIEMHTSNGLVLDVILNQLLQKTPNPRIAALLKKPGFSTSVSPKLISYVKAVLQKEADKHLDQATRVRTAPLTYERQYLMTQVRTTDRGEVFVDQLNQKRRVLDVRSAAQMADIKEPVGGAAFMEKLRSGQYSHLQLSYLGTKLLIAARPIGHEDAPHKNDHRHVDIHEPFGHMFRPRTEQDKRDDHLAKWPRRIGALLLAGTLISGFHYGKDKLDKYLEQTQRDSSGIGRAIPPAGTDWEIEPHGLSPEGYYQLDTRNIYDHGSWSYDNQTVTSSVIYKPNSLVSDHEPHLTLSRLLSGLDGRDSIELPVKEETHIGVVRANTNSGPIPVGLVRTKNGKAIAMFLGNDKTVTSIEYDLVAGDTSHQTWDDPDDSRSYIEGESAISHEDFRYDNTKALDTLTKHKNDSDRLIYDLNQARICNCNLCATRLALLAQRYGIPADYTTGYINDGVSPATGASDLRLEGAESHAWVTLPDGTILDSTPYKLSEAQKKAGDSNTQQPGEVDNKALLKILGTFAGYLGLQFGGVEAAKLYKKRQQNWFNKQSTREAYNFLSWVSFGNKQAEPIYPRNGATPEDLQTSIATSLDKQAVNDYLTNQPFVLENAVKLSYRQRMTARKLAKKVLST